MLFRNLLEMYIQFGFDIYNKFKQEKGGVSECYVLSPLQYQLHTCILGKMKRNPPKGRNDLECTSRVIKQGIN
ncbi:unnamed protein product [Rhizophagus irregularis]|nr:unnamed protein product [Rhizophagus irregularis]